MTTDNSSPATPGTPGKKSNTGKVVALTVTITVLAVAVVLLLWTQFNGKDTAGTAPTETPSATGAPTTEAAPSESATAPTEEASPSTAPAASPLCTAASLTGALDASSGGGAAGSVYMQLVLTNSGSADCILDGYPGVSLVKAGTTEPIGAPAERDPAAPSNGPITLGPGQNASATLRYTQAGNYPDCKSEQANSVLVYPPSDTGHLEIAHPLTACSNADIKLLTIGAFQQ